MNWRTKIPNTKNVFIEGSSYEDICNSIKKHRKENNIDLPSFVEFLDSDGEWIEVESVNFNDSGEIEVMRASHMATV